MRDRGKTLEERKVEALEQIAEQLDLIRESLGDLALTMSGRPATQSRALGEE